MRNMTDDQAAEAARVIVADHLQAGIEFLDITEAVDEFWGAEDPDDETATDEDYRAVADAVDSVLRTLLNVIN